MRPDVGCSERRRLGLAIESGRVAQGSRWLRSQPCPPLNRSRNTRPNSRQNSRAVPLAFWIPRYSGWIALIQRLSPHEFRRFAPLGFPDRCRSAPPPQPAVHAATSAGWSRRLNTTVQNSTLIIELCRKSLEFIGNLLARSG